MKTNFPKPAKAICQILCCSVLILASAAQAAQNAEPYKYAKRFTPGGKLLGEIAPDADGDGQYFPAKRYRYDHPGHPTLVTSVQHGYLRYWQNENIEPDTWQSFTITHQDVFAYDQWGRKEASGKATSSGSVQTLTQTKYDSLGRVSCTAVRLNPNNMNLSDLPSGDCAGSFGGSDGSHGPDRVTQYLYNGYDRVVEERRAVGTSLEQVYVKYTYINGVLRDTVTDANGNTAKYYYDSRDRLRRWCFPSKTTGSGTYNCSDYEDYQYDANSNRTYLRKRDGTVIRYQYDRLNRVTFKNLPAKDVYYKYTLQGLERQAVFDSHSGGDGVFTTYTGFGEVLTETTTMGTYNYQIKHHYDANSNRERITYPDNRQFTFQYDGLDNFKYLRENGSTTIVTGGYDHGGRSKTLSGTGRSTTLNYDSVSRVGSIAHQFSGSTNDLTIGLWYNPASQIYRRNLNNGIYHYRDEGGITGEYEVNGLNQYVGVAGETFTHNNNGNLTSNGKTTFKYDYENRLTRATGEANGVLEYDPKGRLYRFNPLVGGTKTYFLYSGDNLIAEYQNGSITKRYVHAGGGLAPLVSYNGSAVGSSNRTFLHTDHQGSVIAGTNSSGVVQFINTYDAYGVPGYGNEGRFAYTGQMYIPELKMYHYRARVYDPYVGRFLQTDPIGYEDQMNLYAYVGNDPMNNVDPTGMCRNSTECHEDAYDPHVEKSSQANSDGSVTVSRQTEQMGSNGSVTVEQSGSIKNLPQQSLNGAPATPSEKMEDALLDFSEKTGNEVNVHSGMRTPEQNAAVGGAPNSSHLQNEAADISVTGQSRDITATQAARSGLFERTNNYKGPRGVHVDFKNTTHKSGYFEKWVRKPMP